ncbi:hypothetical protein [Nocardioides faecalis]|uniref:hypothetical protein n=1 Tax=Nocardioides faecalis TaxID=2803858 RepID=UPI0035591451
MTVAFGDTALGALVGCNADAFGCLELDQLLERDADRIADQIDAITGTERVEKLRQGRLGQGHRWTSFFDDCLAVHTEDPADGRLLHATTPVLKPHHSRGLSLDKRSSERILAAGPQEFFSLLRHAMSE